MPSPSNLLTYNTKFYVAKSLKDAWMYVDHFVPQLKHRWLRNSIGHSPKAAHAAPGVGLAVLSLSLSLYLQWSVHQSCKWPIQMGSTPRFGHASLGRGTYAENTSRIQTPVAARETHVVRTADIHR